MQRDFYKISCFSVPDFVSASEETIDLTDFVCLLYIDTNENNVPENAENHDEVDTAGFQGHDLENIDNDIKKEQGTKILPLLCCGLGLVCTTIKVFSMSTCIARSRLVHNDGYIQKLLQIFNSPEIV